MKIRRRNIGPVEREAERVFRRRAERLQSECGWCGHNVGEDEPVFGVEGKALPGMDLASIQGRAIEIKLEKTGKSVLAGVVAFDSDAKKAGTDLIFMVCSEKCGRSLRAAIAADLAERR